MFKQDTLNFLLWMSLLCLATHSFWPLHKTIQLLTIHMLNESLRYSCRTLELRMILLEWSGISYDLTMTNRTLWFQSINPFNASFHIFFLQINVWSNHSHSSIQIYEVHPTLLKTSIVHPTFFRTDSKNSKICTDLTSCSTEQGSKREGSHADTLHPQ